MNRQPRAIILLNGQPVTGWYAWECDSNTYYQADTAKASFAVSALPPDFGPDWFASQTRIEMEIKAGFPANPDNFSHSELNSIFIGRVDDIEYNPVDAEINLSARDFSADLIDAKTTEKWQNQTPGDIAMALAERHGLTPVISDPGGLAGTYYQIDHAKLNSQRTEWDLLTYLAHETGSRVFVRGRELRFEPVPDDAAMPVYPLAWKKPDHNSGSPVADVISLEFSRTLTVAKEVVVRVRSWSAKTKSRVEAIAIRPKSQGGIATVTVKAGKGEISTGDAQVYAFTFPGLTQEQVLQKAQELRRQISSHEMKLEATMPGNNSLTIDTIIAVSGTGTAYDQRYYPSSITRKMNSHDGYIMSVSAKNHTPETEVMI